MANNGGHCFLYTQHHQGVALPSKQLSLTYPNSSSKPKCLKAEHKYAQCPIRGAQGKSLQSTERGFLMRVEVRHLLVQQEWKEGLISAAFFFRGPELKHRVVDKS